MGARRGDDGRRRTPHQPHRRATSSPTPPPPTPSPPESAAVADAADGLTLAATSRAHPDQLAAASEAYGLSPADTAAVLAGTTSAAVVLDTLTIRCDGDTDATTAIATQAGIPESDIDTWLHPTPPAPITAIRPSIDLDTVALLAALPPPGPAPDADPIQLLDTLTAGVEPATLEPSR